MLKTAWRCRGVIPRSRHHDLPEALEGPGRILKRQTKTWTLKVQGGNTWRVRFRYAAEVCWRRDEYERLELLRMHPVLAQHQEPMVDILQRFTGESGGWEVAQAHGDPLWPGSARDPC